jgi:hypothetical protein
MKLPYGAIGSTGDTVAATGGYSSNGYQAVRFGGDAAPKGSTIGHDTGSGGSPFC